MVSLRPNQLPHWVFSHTLLHLDASKALANRWFVRLTAPDGNGEKFLFNSSLFFPFRGRSFRNREYLVDKVTRVFLFSANEPFSEVDLWFQFFKICVKVWLYEEVKLKTFSKASIHFITNIRIIIISYKLMHVCEPKSVSRMMENQPRKFPWNVLKGKFTNTMILFTNTTKRRRRKTKTCWFSLKFTRVLKEEKKLNISIEFV